MMKRTLDVVACALLMLLCWPFLILIFVAIRLQSPGSPVFAQTRVGKGEIPFTCYKFRTMQTGTANVPTHQVDASSITSIGHFLRKFKLDELPQLYNVLVGDMSLVGPRPGLPSQIELVEARRKLGVFNVRPGVTGLAQVRGVDMSDPVRLAEVDAQYIKAQGLSLDLYLILSTLAGKGVGIDRVVVDRK